MVKYKIYKNSKIGLISENTVWTAKLVIKHWRLVICILDNFSLWHSNMFKRIVIITVLRLQISLQLKRTNQMLLKPLSQLAPDRFKTPCERKFSKFVRPVASVARCIAFVLCNKMGSHQVASKFWTCSNFRGKTWRFKALYWVSRTVAQRCTTLC